MKTKVNTLIFDLLASGRTFHLPDVGTLVIRRRSAGLSSNRLTPPARRVVFLPEERGESLRELAGREAYEVWVREARTPEGFDCEGAGLLRRGRFTPSPELEHALNPYGHEPMGMCRRFWRNPWTWFFVAFFALSGLIFAGWSLYQKGTLGARAVPVSGPTAQGPLLRPEPTELPDLEGMAYDDAEPVNRSFDDAPSVSAPDAARRRGTPEAAEGGAAERSEAAGSSDVPSVKAGLSYVVAGVFDEEVNAVERRDRIQRSNPDIMARLYRRGARWIVSIYENDAAGQAESFQRRILRRQDPSIPRDIWVYTAE